MLRDGFFPANITTNGSCLKKEKKIGVLVPHIGPQSQRPIKSQQAKWFTKRLDFQQAITKSIPCGPGIYQKT
jgi:hypothetical protein